METFYWAHQKGASVSAAPKVKVIKFGDGYEQRVKDGINNHLRSYSLTFIGLTEEMNLINKFLSDHGAVKSFYWRAIDSYQLIKVVCRSWTLTIDGPATTITTTFEEVVA